MNMLRYTSYETALAFFRLMKAWFSSRFSLGYYESYETVPAFFSFIKPCIGFRV
jgi:hypothetical protein